MLRVVAAFTDPWAVDVLGSLNNEGPKSGIAPLTMRSELYPYFHIPYPANASGASVPVIYTSTTTPPNALRCDSTGLETSDLHGRQTGLCDVVTGSITSAKITVQFPAPWGLLSQDFGSFKDAKYATYTLTVDPAFLAGLVPPSPPTLAVTPLSCLELGDEVVAYATFRYPNQPNLFGRGIKFSVNGTATLRSDCVFKRYTNPSGIAKFGCTVMTSGGLVVKATFPVGTAPDVSLTVVPGTSSSCSGVPTKPEGALDFSCSDATSGTTTYPVGAVCNAQCDEKWPLWSNVPGPDGPPQANCRRGDWVISGSCGKFCHYVIGDVLRHYSHQVQTGSCANYSCGPASTRCWQQLMLEPHAVHVSA